MQKDLGWPGKVTKKKQTEPLHAWQPRRIEGIVGTAVASSPGRTLRSGARSCGCSQAWQPRGGAIAGGSTGTMRELQYHHSHEHLTRYGPIQVGWRRVLANAQSRAGSPENSHHMHLESHSHTLDVFSSTDQAKSRGRCYCPAKSRLQPEFEASQVSCLAERKRNRFVFVVHVCELR